MLHLSLTTYWLILKSHELVPEHRFFDHIAHYCSSVNFNEFVCSRLCNEFEPIFVYGNWMIHDWLEIDLVKMIFLMNFCGSWFLQIVFLRILDEHVNVFSWILIFHVFWKKFQKILIKIKKNFWPAVVAAVCDDVPWYQAQPHCDCSSSDAMPVHCVQAMQQCVAAVGVSCTAARNNHRL